MNLYVCVDFMHMYIHACTCVHMCIPACAHVTHIYISGIMLTCSKFTRRTTGLIELHCKHLYSEWLHSRLTGY